METITIDKTIINVEGARLQGEQSFRESMKGIIGPGGLNEVCRKIFGSNVENSTSADAPVEKKRKKSFQDNLTDDLNKK